MTIKLPPIPNPPPPNVQRFDERGRPTTAQVVYENDLKRVLQAIKTAIEGM